MLICSTLVTIVQTPSKSYPNRTKTLTLNFVTEFNSSDSWRELTNKASITFPKNIYYKDANGVLQNLGNKNTNIGGFSANDPMFLTGDKITIVAGYTYFDKLGNVVANAPGGNLPSVSTIFSGYIVRVDSKKPITLHLEDNMYQLKQIAAPSMTFPASQYSMEQMLQYLLKGTPFTVNQTAQTNIGDFITQNETVCDVLNRLRKTYHFESYFRGNQLRLGIIVYIESEAVLHNFSFQDNIISDELQYQRKDDIVMSAVAYSFNKVLTGKTRKDGKASSQSQRLEVLVTLQNGSFTTKIRTPGQTADFAPNTVGERRTLYYNNVYSTAILTNYATLTLQKYFYTGFKGTFTTFGLPFVKMGDNANITDNILPERNGIYKVKSVKYSGGVNGLRQVIELDYKIK